MRPLFFFFLNLINPATCLHFDPATDGRRLPTFEKPPYWGKSRAVKTLKGWTQRCLIAVSKEKNVCPRSSRHCKTLIICKQMPAEDLRQRRLPNQIPCPAQRLRVGSRWSPAAHQSDGGFSKCIFYYRVRTSRGAWGTDACQPCLQLPVWLTARWWLLMRREASEADGFYR